MAQWVDSPYNARHVRKIKEINRRRTKSDNASVEFNNKTEGETVWLGSWWPNAETYGAHRLWVLLRPIQIDVDGDSEGLSPSEEDDNDKDPELSWPAHMRISTLRPVTCG